MNLLIDCRCNSPFSLFDFVFPIQIIWRHQEEFFFFKVGHFHAHTQSFWSTRQKFKYPKYRHMIYIGKKIDMRDRSIIWRCYEDVRLENVHISKGISTPSLLKYMDMATLKFSLLTLLWRKSFLDFKCKSKIGVRLTRMLIYIFSHWTCPFEPK